MLQNKSAPFKAYVFFALSIMLIWLLDLPYILALQNGREPSTFIFILLLLGNYSPMLSAVLLTWMERGWSGVKSLFAQLRPGTSPYWTYLLAFGYQSVILVLAALMCFLLSGQPTSNPDDYPIYYLPIIFAVVFFQAGLAEEVGWTGYGLALLKKSYSSLKASIVLGVFWAIWHAPGFFIPGTFHYQKPTIFAVWYFIGVIGYSIFKTFLYNSSKNNLLLVVLCHTAANVTFAYLASNLLWNHIVLDPFITLLVSIMIVLIWGRELNNKASNKLENKF